MTTTSYPLTWPPNRPRTGRWKRESSRFKTSFAVARDELRREISRLGGKNLVISTNIPLRNDGLPYATYKKLDDEGVAIYFTYKGKSMCFACDRWTKVEDNMRAICKTIDALRGVARWGTGDMLEAAFNGFTAIPPPAESAKRAWWDVLGVSRGASQVTIRDAYLRRRSEHHPDKGGSASGFREVEDAYRQASQQR